jgi:hypothetical protein
LKTTDEKPTTKKDRTVSEDESHSTDTDLSFDEEEGHGIVVLSKTATTSANEKTESTEESRKVSNLCAICLEEYQEGDVIVWSANKNCQHAFHSDCLASYLVRLKTGETHRCPYCRQDFFTDDSDECQNQETSEK